MTEERVKWSFKFIL